MRWGETTTFNLHTNGNVHLKTISATGINQELSQEFNYYANNDKIKEITDQSKLHFEFNYDFLNRLQWKKEKWKDFGRV